MGFLMLKGSINGVLLSSVAVWHFAVRHGFRIFGHRDQAARVLSPNKGFSSVMFRSSDNFF